MRTRTNDNYDHHVLFSVVEQGCWTSVRHSRRGGTQTHKTSATLLLKKVLAGRKGARKNYLRSPAVRATTERHQRRRRAGLMPRYKVPCPPVPGRKSSRSPSPEKGKGKDKNPFNKGKGKWWGKFSSGKKPPPPPEQDPTASCHLAKGTWKIFL